LSALLLSVYWLFQNSIWISHFPFVICVATCYLLYLRPLLLYCSTGSKSSRLSFVVDSSFILFYLLLFRHCLHFFPVLLLHAPLRVYTMLLHGRFCFISFSPSSLLCRLTVNTTLHLRHRCIFSLVLVGLCSMRSNWFNIIYGALYTSLCPAVHCV
jgi:hypothetical protein